MKDITPNSALTLSIRSLGEGTATLNLEESYWHTISGLREGYRIRGISDGNYLGEAVILEDPKKHYQSIKVSITSPFSSFSYEIDEWELFEPDTYDLKKLLPDFLRDTDLFGAYLDTLKDKVSNPISDSIARLEMIRREDKVDFEFLKKIKTTLGFIIDISDREFNEDEHRRLIRDMRNFYEISGTKNFINFFSYIKSAEVTVEELYTTDYKEFITTKLDDTYYLTNKVDLTYDLTLYPDASDIGRLEKLFYYLAPVVTVINNLIGSAVNKIPHSIKFLQSANAPDYEERAYDQVVAGVFSEITMTGTVGLESYEISGMKTL